MDVRHFVTAEELAISVAAEIALCLGAAIEERGRASLVVSGGKSPIPVFRHLSGAALDWSKVTITLADERWVPLTHPESNELAIRKHLLVGAAAAARFVPLKTPADCPADALESVCDSVASIGRPFDLVLLGMGADGHTASWFPDSPQIRECLAARKLCYAIESPAARYPRMTLTPAAILNARLVMLLFSGNEKRQVFERARLPGLPEDLPVRTVLRQTAVPMAVRVSEQDAPSVG